MAPGRLSCWVKADAFAYKRPLATKKSELGGALTIAIYVLVVLSFGVECIKWTRTRYSIKASTVELDGTSFAKITDGLSLEVKLNGKPFYDPRYFTVQFAANRIEARSNVTGKRARSKVLFDAVPCKDGRHMCPAGKPGVDKSKAGVPSPDSIQGTYFSKHGFQFFTVELRPCFKDYAAAASNDTTVNGTSLVSSDNATSSKNDINDTTSTTVLNSQCLTKEELDDWLMTDGNYVTASLTFANHLSWTYNKTASVYLNLEPGMWQGVETHFTLTEYKVADNIIADETKKCPRLAAPASRTNNSNNSNIRRSVWEPHCGHYTTFSGKDVRRSAGNRLAKFYLKLDDFMTDEVLLPNSLAGIVLTLTMVFMAAHSAVGTLGQTFAKKCGVVVPEEDCMDEEQPPPRKDKYEYDHDIYAASV